VEVKASLNNLRINPRKVRLVTGLIKGLSLDDARGQLRFMIKRASGPLAKLLDSAAANAENNFGLVKSNLFIKKITVNEGRKLKRFRPKGFGRAMAIQRKTSYVDLILEEFIPGLKQEVRKKKQELMEEKTAERMGEYKPEQENNISEEPKLSDKGGSSPTGQAGAHRGKKEIKPEVKQKPASGLFGGLKKRMFRRKSI